MCCRQLLPGCLSGCSVGLLHKFSIANLSLSLATYFTPYGPNTLRVGQIEQAVRFLEKPQFLLLVGRIEGFPLASERGRVRREHVFETQTVGWNVRTQTGRDFSLLPCQCRKVVFAPLSLQGCGCGCSPT